MVSRESTGTATRARILEVAETRFARKGYEGAHLQAIAEEVGVQKTALYYYFPSKSKIYLCVLERILGDMDRCIREIAETPTPHPERLLEAMDALNDLLASRPNYSQILLRIFVDEVAVDLSSLEPLITGLIEMILGFFHEGVEVGAFRKISSRHFLQSMLGMLVFHYAATPFSAAMIGVEDVYSDSARTWRAKEVRRLIRHGILTDPVDR